ncbi:phage baseplate assembly protein V [Cohnella faecalis]|uniref:Gp5/Type VI secretion system Vgr protein OB-fold domain-containing protein n=1 Tax=Cohnella faecalis TaxID=2315694 RepID=A0A398CPF2_9BACL|nr:phage baseplate assembly protein V [Cohnella faecalis]RIE02588.1 hypothetical protein D3H35_18060 [Cohnella faecalis]
MFNYPPQQQQAGIINGVMIAKVTNNKDPEKLGRVKLKFPLRENEHESDWASVTTFMTGGSRGSVFIPEVDDEVLVAFVLGNLNMPIVVGSLWNKNSKPPTPDENNNIRKIVSKHGHEFIFDDTSSAAKVTLKSKKGMQLEFVDQNDKVEIKAGSTGPVVTLEGGSSGTLTLKSGTNKITIDNKGNINVDSTTGITIKSTQIKVEATAQMTLKANASLNLESSGIVNIKGSLVKIN